MVDRIKLGDAIYVYERLQKIAKQLQKTRRPEEILEGMGRGVLASLHTGVSRQTQNLTNVQAESKLFYNAVTEARRALDKYRTRFVDMQAPISQEDSETLIGMVKFMQHQPIPPLADRNKVNDKTNEIIVRLQVYSKLDVKTWTTSPEEVAELQHKYMDH